MIFSQPTTHHWRASGQFFLKISLCASLLLLYGCSDESPADQQQAAPTTTAEIKPEIKNETANGQTEYEQQTLLQKIAFGQASFFEIRKSLSQTDIAALSNTIHALYAMRWNRQVQHLLRHLWNMNTEIYPELAWDEISKPPVRIALASTIFRIQSLDTLAHYDLQQYKSYIRAHKYDEHEFHRAQVAVALGLAGDPVDVPYLIEMASSDNHYVIQSAITALGLMNDKQASDGLIALYKQFRQDDSNRADLILDVLKKGYDLHPSTTPPITTDEKAENQ